MKAAFVCGPYRSATIRGTVENIQHAEELALDLWRFGYAALCPRNLSKKFWKMVELFIQIAGRAASTAPGPRPVRRSSVSRTIPLTRGYVAIVDDDDYEWLSEFKWCSTISETGKVYAAMRDILGDPQAPLRKGLVQMHRKLLGLRFGDGLLADHISGDTLDNRRRNIRVVNKSQNSMNRPTPSNSTTGVTGVFWNNQAKKYQAQIKLAGRQRYLGIFETLEGAAEARRFAEEQLFGEHGYDASQRGDSS